MTREQKKIVLVWAATILLVVGHAIFNEWIRKNSGLIDLPIFLTFIGIAWYADRRVKPGPDFTIDRIIAKHFWIKAYLAAYCMFFVAGIFYVISNKIILAREVNSIWLILPIVMLAFPALVIHQMKAYKKAGEISNSRDADPTGRSA